MEHIKIATLNINGLSFPTKVAMLVEFMRLQEIDILLVQEVTKPVLHNIYGYNMHYNIEATMRSTAIITRDSISLENVTMLPSGRTIAAKFREIWIINLYTSSGMARKQDREKFYYNEVPYIIATVGDHILLDGDFNCILDPTDTTGSYNYSRALQELKQGLAMVDTWQPNTDRRVYTHISASGASRLDCIYITKELNSRKRGVEVVAVAFTDHPAVCLRLSAEFPILRTGHGMWKMDNDVLTEITGTNKMRTAPTTQMILSRYNNVVG